MPRNPSYSELQRRCHTLEDELRRREHFFNNVLNYIPDLIFVKDGNHRWVYVNDTFCAALGHQREALIGKTDYDFHPKAEADIFWEMDNRVLKTGGANVNQEVYTNTRGESRTLLTRKSVFKDEAGQRFIVGIAHDITEQKRAESALADSERRLADIIAFLPDPTWVIDIDGRVIAWNRAMEKLTGVKKEAILGQGSYAHAVPFYGEARPTLIDLVLKRDKSYEKRYLSLQEENGQLAASVSFNPALGEGGRYLQASAAKLFDAEGKVVGAIESVRDITAVKQSEQDRERLIAELQDAVANVRTLKGLLPICASCKKVRDDQGYWNQIEAYLKRHTEADFSHGLCPDCLDKLYGKQDWYKQRNPKKTK